jgi:hypothetical protein
MHSWYFTKVLRLFTGAKVLLTLRKHYEGTFQNQLAKLMDKKQNVRPEYFA